MADNTENVLVEFDYQNIFIVDPNKVIDKDGKAKDRLIKHENLVTYVNLETSILPRTKLANGLSSNDAVETVKIADINFLNPGKKRYLDNSYTNELTGAVTEGGRQNQVTLTGSTSSQFKQNVTNVTDNGLLGITSVEIKINTSFLPTIRVELEDVKGRAMFEAGDNSPYAAFFNLPYPLFKLTLKGYYGKAVQLPIMLQNFTSRYDTGSGNYKISLTFYTYKYTVLSELSVGYLLATPHMYKTNLKIEDRTQTNSPTTKVSNSVVEKGYQKIKEVYAEYKSKGLIDDNFPEITINELVVRLEIFTKRIVESFTTQNIDAITNIDNYKKDLLEYQKKVFYNLDSWFKKNLDYNKPFIVKIGADYREIYRFNNNIISDNNKKIIAIGELNLIITEYTTKLNTNGTLGAAGTYEVNGKKKSSSIVCDILPGPVPPSVLVNFTYFGDINSVEWDKTYERRKGQKISKDDPLLQTFIAQENVKAEIFGLQTGDQSNQVPNFYIFEGPNYFITKIDALIKKAQELSKQIETDLTNALAQQLQSNDSGIGFIPTIRNVMAVIFASGEGFLRLMEEVHKKAWDVNDNKDRKNAVFNDTPNSDNLLNGQTNIPIYPWPQYLEETTNQDAKERFEIKYPGDIDSLSKTKGYLWSIWPEIEFVEEFIKGFVERSLPIVDQGVLGNQRTDTNYVTLDSIEFPITSEIYQNKEEVKFIYEIYERIYLESHYSKLDRGQSDLSGVYQSIAETEANNLVYSLSSNSPFLIGKLKNLGLNANNFVSVLKHISNEGNGQSWQNFIRGIYNTVYIKNFVDVSPHSIIPIENTYLPQYNPTASYTSEPTFVKYVEGTTTNVIDFSDTFPFTNNSWLNTNMAFGSKISSKEQGMDTQGTLFYNNTKKKPANYLDGFPSTLVRPVTNFKYYNFTRPTQAELLDLKSFYQNRIGVNAVKQNVTEGSIYYINYSGKVNSTQSTSILNTPYFINAIMTGVENYRDFKTTPYREAAYLFLNSLPLSTLKEKYLSLEGQGTSPLKYMFATFKKMGALHKIPYVWILKYGSIWNRYKDWKDTGVDYISNVWKNFDYSGNYDPVFSSTTTNYSFSADGETYNISLQLNSQFTGGTTSIMNLGFYPKLINYFNFFYQGGFSFTAYTSDSIQSQINNGSLSMYPANQSLIRQKSFDTTSPNRSLIMTNWSCLINKSTEKSFILPSWGNYGTTNQVAQECFDSLVNPVLKQEVTGNTAVYNGSVRLFWSLPNYGYFDNELLSKPTPEQYLKSIFSDREEQDSFGLTGSASTYSDISEMFSVFEKDILDSFETEFLNYSKSVYDFNYESDEFSLQNKILNLTSGYVEIDCDTGKKSIKKGYEESLNNLANSLNISVDKLTKLALGEEQIDNPEQNNSVLSFRNFHNFMRTYMLIDKPSGTTADSIIKDASEKQDVSLSKAIQSFIDYDVIFKHGNPSNFDRRVFETFSTLSNIIPLNYKGYYSDTPGALPYSGGTLTLQQSKLAYPESWTALEKNVGFSNINKLKYTDNGSYITDFFIDMDVAFNEDNIVKFAQIIKLYATQKLNDPTLNAAKFITLMTDYLNKLQNFDDNILNSAMVQMRNRLPDVSEEVQDSTFSQLEGPQTRVELWETFKSLNDKWIAGTDFINKTLFEDVLFLDRASRDLGDKILVDIFKLKDLLKNPNPKMSMQTLVQTIIQDNHFVIFSTPSYVNFYNVQDAAKNPIPKIEGNLEFANTLFGTFTEVDYRQTGPKMVCLYAGVPSNYLDMKDNVDFRYKNDAFDLRRSSDNPLVENLVNKNDWDKSNRVVGFNVDIGIQNQQVFNNFSVSQENGKNTSESLQVLNQMANIDGGKNTATQNVSLYNLYKNRSYTCQVTMMGNAIIQPTMYFNLRYVPMFSGPYMILEVNHSIKPGTFDTVITGIRQPVYSLPKIDNYIQSIKQNLLKSVIEKAKVEKAKKNETAKTTQKTQKDATKAADSNKKPTQSTSTPSPNGKVGEVSTISTTGNCASKLYKNYQDTYNQISKPKTTTTSFKKMYNTIQSLTVSYLNVNNQLNQTIFVTMYLNCGKENGFSSYENNFTGVLLSQNWGNNQNCNLPPVGSSLTYFPYKEYFCLTTNDNDPGDPYAKFETVENNIQMLVSRWYNRDLPTLDDAEGIFKFWYCNFGSTTKQASDYDNFKKTEPKQVQLIIDKVQKAIEIQKGIN
jgi:hypothetical protein